MEPVVFPKSNLERQTREASEMETKSRGSNLLNRKGEWGQNLPPKLTIGEGDADDKRKPERERKRKSSEATTTNKKTDCNTMGDTGPQTMAPAKRMRREATIKSRNSTPPRVQDISKYFQKTERQEHQKRKDENTTQDPLPCHHNSASFDTNYQQQLGVQQILRGKVESNCNSCDEQRLYKEVKKPAEVTVFQTEDKPTQPKITPEEETRNLGPKSNKD